MRREGLAVLCLVAGCGVGARSAAPAETVTDVAERLAHARAEAWPEADRLFRGDPRWLGADAAFSVDLGDERILWLFGDTFVAEHEPRTRARARMVRNSIGLQRGADPSRASLEFHWGPGPSSWMPEQGERWFWPQHGVRLPGGPLILFFARLHATPGEGLGFRADGWSALAIDGPDRDPREWSRRALEPARLPPGLVPAQGLLLRDGFVLGLAIREPGDHAGFALRIAVDALARGELSAMELWTGTWERARPDLAPLPVIADAAPESSLHFDPHLERFVHVRSLGFGATTLAWSFAERITGPWSQPTPFFRPPESLRERAFVYAGKAHPELAGADLVATYAANRFDFAELVADTSLYWPRFVRVDFR